jgi:hypothetical protein
MCVYSTEEVGIRYRKVPAEFNPRRLWSSDVYIMGTYVQCDNFPRTPRCSGKLSDHSYCTPMLKPAQQTNSGPNSTVAHVGGYRDQVALKLELEIRFII